MAIGCNHRSCYYRAGLFQSSGGKRHDPTRPLLPLSDHFIVEHPESVLHAIKRILHTPARGSGTSAQPPAHPTPPAPPTTANPNKTSRARTTVATGRNHIVHSKTSRHASRQKTAQAGTRTTPRLITAVLIPLLPPHSFGRQLCASENSLRSRAATSVPIHHNRPLIRPDAPSATSQQARRLYRRANKAAGATAPAPATRLRRRSYDPPPNVAWAIRRESERSTITRSGGVLLTALIPKRQRCTLSYTIAYARACRCVKDGGVSTRTRTHPAREWPRHVRHGQLHTARAKHGSRSGSVHRNRRQPQQKQVPSTGRRRVKQPGPLPGSKKIERGRRQTARLEDVVEQAGNSLTQKQSYTSRWIRSPDRSKVRLRVVHSHSTHEFTVVGRANKSRCRAVVGGSA